MNELCHLHAVRDVLAAFVNVSFEAHRAAVSMQFAAFVCVMSHAILFIYINVSFEARWAVESMLAAFV